MKALENFSNFFRKKKPTNADESLEQKAADGDVEGESALQNIKLKFDEIESLKSEASESKNKNNKSKINRKIQTLKNQFKKEFKLDYKSDFDKITQNYFNNSESKPDSGSALGAASEDNLEEPLVEGADLNDQEEKNEVKPDLEPGPEWNYRRHLENLKIEKGGIQKGKYQMIENVSLELEKELNNITDSLVVEKLDNNLEANLKDLALKTGLKEEEIKEIYRTEENNLISEAKEEINKNSSRWGRVSLAVGKSVGYILATTSTVATLGLGVGASMSFIAAIRILDRVVTEKRLKKSLDAKVKEIKMSKTETDKAAIQNRLAAAISLKKKIEIGKVNLDDKGERTKLIDEYIEEQRRSGLIQLDPDKVMERKDQIIRAVEGLDDIDKSNAAREEKMNKKGLFDKMKKLEDLVSGKSTREKVVSTAVFVGLGIAAREVPGIRLAMAAYAGYRLGALIGDHVVKNDAIPEYIGESNSKNNYNIIRKKLLDHNFQKNNPEEYLKLKQRADVYENEKARVSLEALNKSFEKKLQVDKFYQKNDREMKIVLRVGGAVIGLVGGELIRSLAHHFFNENGASPKNHDTISEQPHGKGTAVHPESPADSLNHINKSDSTATVVDSTLAPKTNSIPDGSSQEVVPSPSHKSGVWENNISNKGLKTGEHDSVWRSTEQIFKDQAQKLGYKGDLNDKSALEHWAQSQTGKTLNNSGTINDKVFEGNKVILEQDAKGNYHIKVEEATGLKPGHLEHLKTSGTKEDNIPEQEAPIKKEQTNYEELKKEFIEKDKAAFTDKSNKIADTLLDQKNQNISETIKNSKIFSSIDNLKELPNNQTLNLGDLIMSKQGNTYNFKTEDGQSFKMLFNHLGESGQNDKFTIVSGNHVLDGSKLAEAIPLKQTIYDNLPDKRSSLAKQLLQEIINNKKQAKFLKEF
ncbi:MAG: hypothetical protein WC249_02485 [Patescibacteria group bacterium]|jgi:hypothetical protein